MNIFLPYTEPERIAAALDDRRLVAQMKECGQLLNTASRWFGYDDSLTLSYPHHPVTKWVAKSRTNYQFTLELMKACRDEKLVRWSDNPAPITDMMIRRFQGFVEKWQDVCPYRPKFWVNCARRADMDLDFTDIQPVPLAYRMYLKERWRRDDSPSWSGGRERPSWG